jgi:hypothetical protein
LDNRPFATTALTGRIVNKKKFVIYQWAIRKEMRLAKNEIETFLSIPLKYYFIFYFVCTTGTYVCGCDQRDARSPTTNAIFQIVHTIRIIQRV